MRVTLGGASGLIGQALIESFRSDGVEITQLVRREPRSPGEVAWDPQRGVVPRDVLAESDVVINLSGASIGHLPWTSRYRSELLWSRVTPTRVLAGALRDIGSGAPRFISSSAVGFYGSVPRAVLTEADGRGPGFLASLCEEWEASALAAADVAPVTLLRTAPVLHPRGVLAPLIKLTRLGLSGPLGRGTQVWPWISLDDEVRGIRHVIDQDIDGPVNLAGPERATANDIGFALARRMNRPYLLRAPALGLRTALGRPFADGVLLSDADVRPAVLEGSGFTFTHPTVESAIASVVPAG